MKLIDSCVWAEVLQGSPTGKLFKPLMPTPAQLLVPTMVLYEVSKWLARTMDSQAADEVMITLQSAKVVDATSSIALQAAELSITYKLHAIDALIYATALEHDAVLVTCDAHFKGLPQVEYTAKVK
ncbi:MAG: type II toxin-antitoxin system VapC family toxin [Polaromonas sp.]|nr:type II toxin-antitoxin system VapC family toxin [Polaromonas sp.]